MTSPCSLRKQGTAFLRMCPVTSLSSSGLRPDVIASPSGRLPTTSRLNKTRKEYKRKKRVITMKQYGGKDPIQRLSFESMINKAKPNIKACLCDFTKTLYTNSTSPIFQNYTQYYKVAERDPEIINHIQFLYGEYLNEIMHLNNPQIKIDIRNHVLGKCPPIEDPEIKFSGTE